MSAPTLTQIMTGIETRLKTISGLRTTPFAPAQCNPPQAYLSIPSIHYHEAFAHGTIRIDPVVAVITSKALDRVDQPALSQYMDVTGSKSVHAAIEGDRTLGLDITTYKVDCVVVDAKESDIELGGIKFYGAVFTLHVVAAGV